MFVFHGGGGQTCPATPAGVHPSERFPSSSCRLVAAGYHSALTCRWQKLSDGRKVYAQMGSQCGTALCTSLRGPHKYDAIPVTQPPRESRYNDSLTGSNACATMALIGRAFLSSQSLSARPTHLASVPQAIHCSSTGRPFCTGVRVALRLSKTGRRGASLLIPGASRPHHPTACCAPHRPYGLPETAVCSPIQRRKSDEPPAIGSTTRAGLS
jgi:hypothetical protein